MACLRTRRVSSAFVSMASRFSPSGLRISPRRALYSSQEALPLYKTFFFSRNASLIYFLDRIVAPLFQRLRGIPMQESLLLSRGTAIVCPRCEFTFSVEQGFARQAFESLASQSAQGIAELKAHERALAERRAQELLSA